jgi:hypothetical protein
LPLVEEVEDPSKALVDFLPPLQRLAGGATGEGSERGIEGRALGIERACGFRCIHFSWDGWLSQDPDGRWAEVSVLIGEALDRLLR